MTIPLLAWLDAASVVAVLPTLFTVGPLALLAWLFPATFGGLALTMRRGVVLCTVLASISTLYLLQASLRGHLAGTIWAAPWALWLCSTAIAGAGFGWAMRRTRKMPALGKQRPTLVALVLLAMACGCMALATVPRQQAAGMRIVWAFEPVERGAIVSSPLVAGNFVYVGTIRDGGDVPRGAVYALDRRTGKEVWRFNDEGRMLHMYSSPCLADGRLYIGEGMHANFACKLYCLDAASGRRLWQFSASSHIESSPTVADGKVFVGGGDDGLYCLDAGTGEKIWNFREGLHIDASPVVAGNFVYAASGISRRCRVTQILCLDRDSGRVHWRRDTDLPVWGSPLVVGDSIFFGLGNGRLLTSVRPPEQPAGALLCVAADSGETRFRFPAKDGVLARPAADQERVYFTSRDGFCYALELATGNLAWRFELGSPTVTTPALVGTRLYLAPSLGPVYCLDAATGRQQGSFNLRSLNGASVSLVSSPAALEEDGPDGIEPVVYLGTEVLGPLGSAAVLYALRGPR